MSEYTPTTDEVRVAWAGWTNAFGRGLGIGKDEFDRWLAAHDAELEAENERLQAENERLLDDLKQERRSHRGAHDAGVAILAERDAAREQVRQRDEAIERVRALANEWERSYPSLMVGPLLRAVLDGDGCPECRRTEGHKLGCSCREGRQHELQARG